MSSPVSQGFLLPNEEEIVEDSGLYERDGCTLRRKRLLRNQVPFPLMRGYVALRVMNSKGETTNKPSELPIHVGGGYTQPHNFWNVYFALCQSIANIFRMLPIRLPLLASQRIAR